MTDILYEEIAGRQVSLAVVIGLVGAVGLALFTIVFQFSKVIDLTASFTDTWLWILFTGEGVCLTLINYGIHQMRKTKQAPRPVPSPPETERQGTILDPFEKRPTIERLLEDAKDGSEVWVLGIDCGSWPVGLFENMKDFVTRRKLSFTFLVADPNPNESDWRRAEGHQISYDSTEGILRSLGQLWRLKEQLKKQLGSDYSDKVVQVKRYNLPVIHSMVVINPKITEIAEIQVAHYLYGVDPLNRTSLLLKRDLMTKEQQKGIFDLYMKSFKHVLDNSKKLTDAELRSFALMSGKLSQ
jgi:hypothetical protein